MAQILSRTHFQLKKLGDCMAEREYQENLRFLNSSRTASQADRSGFERYAESLKPDTSRQSEAPKTDQDMVIPDGFRVIGG